MAQSTAWMTKKQLLEQILLELRAIHALLEADTMHAKSVEIWGENGVVDKLTIPLGEPIDLDEAVAEMQKIAGAY